MKTSTHSLSISSLSSTNNANGSAQVRKEPTSPPAATLSDDTEVNVDVKVRITVAYPGYHRLGTPTPKQGAETYYLANKEIWAEEEGLEVVRVPYTALNLPKCSGTFTLTEIQGQVMDSSGCGDRGNINLLFCQIF